jgi:hypothetical protein
MGGLGVSKEKAMELANLVLLTYGMYEDFKEKTTLANERDWKFTEVLHGSVERKYDYHNPLLRQLNGETIEYRILAEFWHTDKPVGKLQLETVPFGFIAVKNNGSTKAQEVYIAFRGTLNSQEWAANARFKKAEAVKGVAGEGFIHRGFNSIFETSFTQRLQSFRGFYTNLKRKILRIQPPLEIRQQSIRETLTDVIFNEDLVSSDAKIYITGHSLGGALALLAGRVIANQGRYMADNSDSAKENPYKEKLAICTFAGPRVGDKAFKSAFEDITVIRYVNTEDIVPTVPPATNKLLGEDMKLTPEGLRSYKSAGIASITNTYQARAGSVQRGLEADKNTPFTHVGDQRTFTLSQDSISFNHNHQETYREGILLYHEKESNI